MASFFLCLKQNFIEYHSSKVSSRPDCNFEIPLLWQSGFCMLYSNCCRSCSFEPEIIKNCQSSHNMYSNNILNSQESTTISNACTKSLETYWRYHVYIYVFLFFRKELNLLWCVRQTDVGKQDRFPYWPITSSFGHSTMCYLQDPPITSASRPGLLSRRPLRETAPSGSFSLAATCSHSGLHCLQLSQLEAAAPSGTLSLTAKWIWLWPSLSPTDSGICIYYFITLTHFRLDHMTLFRLFTQVHLWLTARSRVNM